MSVERRTIAIVGSVLLLVFVITGSAFAQAAIPPATSPQIEEVLRQIEKLNASLRDTRTELEESRAEIRELKLTVESLRTKLPSPSETELPDEAATSTTRQVTQEDLQILTERVNEHQQTKVESSSKFRVKLSGMVLLNAFSDFGQVDDVDVPGAALARPPNQSAGSIGGSMRQSILGITGFGPNLLGARTSADLQMDFFGGIPSSYNGVSSGDARLRLARLRMDWQSTSLVGGIDTPFFSPNSPSSYVSVAEPAFAAAGNLWAWTPSFRFAHHFDYERNSWQIEAGLFDPSGYDGYAPQARYPTAGESSRQPAYSLRLSGFHGPSDRRLSIGVAALYTPLRTHCGSKVNGAGLMVDWDIPVTGHFEATGEFFTGKGLQAFGGTPYSQIQARDSGHYATTTAPLLAGVGEIGGWSQLKFRVNSRNEFNVAAGYGGYSSSKMRENISDDYYFESLLSRNESVLVNYIVHPRSDLLFSAEYRYLRTSPVLGLANTADQVGVSAGFLF